jgi:hypothetical protein
VLQAKLKINQTGDGPEQEADRVAEQIMGMPEPANREAGRRAHQSESPAEPGRNSRRLTLQHRAEGMEPATPFMQAQIDAARQAGQALPQSARDFFEPRFGHDFSRVRVHTDARASDAATAVNARAFTVGNDIVFRYGEYSPETPAGRGLLAHELAHVVQQSQSLAPPGLQRQTEPPTFPDFPRLVTALSDDIGENLYDYGHHFYRIATLFPDQTDLLEDAFARYALGKNVLETGYGFLGAGPGTAETLALGTGIIFKGLNFLKNGELVIDYQFNLGGDLKLEAGIDLAVNPDDFTEVRKVDAGLSLIGRF